MGFVEKAGSFYLGKVSHPAKKEATSEELLLLKANNLTTHAICVGMTGSGKTGLGIALLEEAALNQTPALIIDPKGDLANLLLTFPHLSPQEFQPWVDETEAARQNMTTAAYAESVANIWKTGLAKWGQGADRIQRLKAAVEMAIYTPASNAGIPLSVIRSFAAPTKEFMADKEALRDRILSITSSLLGLLGIDADPVKSREYILISTLIGNAWENQQDLDITSLIQEIQTPKLTKIGALDIDTFFPAKDRLALSIKLNNLLASPSFQAWMEGEPLDIQQLLYTPEGKPKLAILSIAHLADSERMFFVTLLLNELLSWMRRQPGTSNLRALLYMDEIFGFFPPSSMPPSKIPMLTLLKQARAFGLGVVLCTQNPVDLDYKGLANCGIWFIGKLQTERDKARVLEGLQVASNGEIDAKSLDNMIASTGNRIFILRSVYEKAPILFETRWTMSYLRGPLTLAQISELTDRSKIQPAPKSKPSMSEASAKPLLASGIVEFFVHNPKASQPVCYRPLVLGRAKMHFVDAKEKIDVWQDINLLAPVNDDGLTVNWEDCISVPEIKNQLDKAPLPDSTFEELPASLTKDKNYENFHKNFTSYLYINQTLTISQYPDLKLSSSPNQSEADFRALIAKTLQEKQQEAIKKIQAESAAKLASLNEKLKRAQNKYSEKQTQVGWQRIETWLSFLTPILDALLGRRVTKGTITKASSSIRRVGKLSKDNQDVEQAEESAQAYQQQINDLQMQTNAEINRLMAPIDPSTLILQSAVIRPRKSDMVIEPMALAWWPI